MNPTVKRRERRYASASSDFLPPAPPMLIPASDASPPRPPKSPPNPLEVSAGETTTSERYIGFKMNAKATGPAVKITTKTQSTAMCRPRKRDIASKLRSFWGASTGSLIVLTHLGHRLPRRYAPPHDHSQRVHRCPPPGDRRFSVGAASNRPVFPPAARRRFPQCYWHCLAAFPTIQSRCAM